MTVKYNNFSDLLCRVDLDMLQGIIETYDCINVYEFIDYVKSGFIDCLEYIPGTGEIVETIA